MFRTSLSLLIITLLEISSWAFLFAWRLESIILEDKPCKGPPLYQVINPGLAFIPRFYVLLLVIKSFTVFKFTRYSNHLLVFYSMTLLSTVLRGFDYFLTDNNWFISSSIEKSFACIDFGLCFILWMIIITAPSELDQRELVDFEDNDDNVLVLQDGRVIRNGRMLSLESTASPLSSISFSWMNSLLKIALDSRISANTLWELPARQRARENYRLFAEQSTASVSTYSLLLRIFKANRTIILNQFTTAIGAVVFHYANPYFLYQLLNYFQSHQKDQQNKEFGYLYCVALFVCSVISTLVASQTLLWGRRWHVNIVHMLNSEIYAHALRLKQINEQTEGDEEEKASLISQDTERLAELASYLHIFYTCPLEIIAGSLFLYQMLGNSFLAGLIVMVITLPSIHYISQKSVVAQTRLADAKSWRTRLLRELCEGMKTIKFLASERRWEEAICNAREDELVKLIKVYTQNTILGLVWFATPIFVTTVSFAWYTLVEKKTLDASTAFVSIVLFGMLRDPLNVVPQAFMAYNDACISFSHIVQFLNVEEKKEDDMPMPAEEEDDDLLDYEEQSKVMLQPSIFEWTHRQASNVSFKLTIPFHLQFPVGKLSVISGSSSSGKSSLLKALLGDMTLVSGDPSCLPSRFLCVANAHKSLVRDSVNPSLYLHKVAYVAQIPWVEHGTVRENILFSESWDDARYRTVLHQCDLLRDLSLFENGDLTIVGDKSMNYNNGVNIEALYHKISLARAVYSKAKTVLIDDIFQVLGKVISTFIYENCICGDLMRGRTVVVVAAYPDMFWARDAAVFAQVSRSESGQDGYVAAVESDPERIVGMIKQRRSDRLSNKGTQEASGDVIDMLFENSNNLAGVFSDEEFFDEASIVPGSIRLIEEESDSRRDYAYTTYFSACGGWQYWTFAILFTLMARLANIAESYWLKEGLLRSVCHAPLQFFEGTLSSEILDRFKKDMETVDASIGWHIGFLLQTALGVFGVVFTIGIILPEFFVASIIAALLYLYIGIVYVRASRELKKLNASSRSPILRLYSDTLNGLLTIRAYGEEWTMMKKMFNKLDDNMRPFYTLWTTNRWLFVRVELLGTLLSLFIAILLVHKMDSIDAGMAGIALTFSTSLLEYVYWLMRQSTTVDMYFESVERINEYLNMPQEPPGIVEGSRPPASKKI
ncbi:hypothetical protein G6F52_008021 [Rhizopus delemar]|nr:hypothetical protein G6F52_008021 [Rhizopus delemar]